MFHCDKCSGEFSVYATPGKCPLCAQWVDVDCTGCGHTAQSVRFIKAGNKCPKCGRDATIPGSSRTSLLLIGGLVGSLVIFAALIYLFATLKTESRPLPDIPTRSTSAPE